MAIPIFEILAGLAVFLLTISLMSVSVPQGVDKIAGDRLPRRVRSNALLRPIAEKGIRRAGASSAADARYLRLLKQADWLWITGEPALLNRTAPFWNVETLWAEKYLTAATYGVAGLAGVWLLLTMYELFSPLISLLAAGVLASLLGYLGWTTPDAALQGAAQQRQRAIGLEMGFRLPELRSDVLAGRTVMSAMRELARRPGGPFVEEVRRVVRAFDVLKDEAQALAMMSDRSAGNEIVAEFVSQLQMAATHGNEVNRVLDVLADSAQQRLLQQITAQGRRNAQEMGRPLAAGSVLILALLIMLPAAFTIGSAMF